MMRPSIVLIILPIPILTDQKRNTPLGILYVAGALEQSPYVSEVKVIDLRGIEADEWLSHIPEANIYGISATSLDYHLAIDLAHRLKEECKGIIVLGGVHATVSNDYDPIFDAVVSGEGEYTMGLVANMCSEGAPKQQLHVIQDTPLDLDSLPLPARHLLPYDSIVSTELVDRETKAPATTLMTSRGCPHDCSFCSNRRLWNRRVRYHSLARVVYEIEHLIDNYGVRHFRFHDDTMTMSKKRLRELREALTPLNITWRGNARVDELDKEAAQLMKACGCIEVGFGIESASQYALDLCRKKVTVEQSILAIEAAKEAGLKTKLFFIIGLPGDFGDVSGRTIEFIKRTEPDAVNLSTLSPFPGCDIYEDPSSFGLQFLTSDVSKYKMFLGLSNGECEEDFAYEYDEMGNDALKYHRRKILEFIAESGLDKIK